MLQFTAFENLSTLFIIIIIIDNNNNNNNNNLFFKFFSSILFRSIFSYAYFDFSISFLE